MLAGGTGSPEPSDRAAAVLDLGHRVGLADVEVGVRQRGDRPGVVQERVAVLDLGREAELVDDVVDGVAVVVDVERVQHVVAEVVEVRPAGRLLERDPVGDQRDGVGLVGADEGVGVGVVGHRVLRDQRGLAVAGRPRRRQGAHDGDQRQRGRQTPHRHELAELGQRILLGRTDGTGLRVRGASSHRGVTGSVPRTRQASPSGPTTTEKRLRGPWTGTSRAQAPTSGPKAAT